MSVFHSLTYVFKKVFLAAGYRSRKVSGDSGIDEEIPHTLALGPLLLLLLASGRSGSLMIISIAKMCSELGCRRIPCCLIDVRLTEMSVKYRRRTQFARCVGFESQGIRVDPA